MLTNSVSISVVVLCALCLAKLHVILSLLIAALTAAIAAGMPIADAMSTLTDGFALNAETALSYLLLGTFATAIATTGLADAASRALSRTVGKNAKLMLVVIAAASCLSQNLIPVHIAFIPILIPPMLPMMNELKIDRRGAACALAFGLKAPYISIPFGFGAIFMGLIAKNMTENGMATTTAEVARYNWMLGAAMLVGLLIAIFVTYSRPREYESRASKETHETSHGSPSAYAATAASIAVVVAVQLAAGSLSLAALCGTIAMVALRAIKWREIDAQVVGGMKLMGSIAFTMLIAGGYAAVIKSTGAVDSLVSSAVSVMGGSKITAAIVMTLVGLLVTMGIGSSFSTIPVTAVFYVPLCAQMGFSTPATILLLSAAAALGDAGSPASDTTLGPTSGLSADGLHDHIAHTCIPTFIHFNIPLALSAIVLSVIL